MTAADKIKELDFIRYQKNIKYTELAKELNVTAQRASTLLKSEDMKLSSYLKLEKIIKGLNS